MTIIDREYAVASRISARLDAMSEDEYQDALALALGRVVAPQQWHWDNDDPRYTPRVTPL